MPKSILLKDSHHFVVVVPAAGVGKRMQAACPKQYLKISGKTILEHTVERLLSHPLISKIILVLSAEDEYFPQSFLANHADVTVTLGGEERVDSVLSGLKSINSDDFPWVLVHDAARPCVTHHDISALISACLEKAIGGILATPVRDTMKRTNSEFAITATEDRSLLWHALTPQMYKTEQLIAAIVQGISQDNTLTDESSAIELMNKPSQVVVGSSQNIKITQPEDLAMAEFILSLQK